MPAPPSQGQTFGALPSPRDFAADTWVLPWKSTLCLAMPSPWFLSDLYCTGGSSRREAAPGTAPSQSRLGRLVLHTGPSTATPLAMEMRQRRHHGYVAAFFEAMAAPRQEPRQRRRFSLRPSKGTGKGKKGLPNKRGDGRNQDRQWDAWMTMPGTAGDRAPPGAWRSRSARAKASGARAAGRV